MQRLAVHFLLAAASLLALGDRRANAQAGANVLGDYGGFFRSVENPTRGMVDFDITRQEGSSFWGSVTMIFPEMQLPFTLQGVVERDGAFHGTAHGEAGVVTFDGRFTDLGGGAAVVVSEYQFPMPTSGRPDRGLATLLRNFFEPNQPPGPPDVNGTWMGTFASARGVAPGPCRLMIEQDRTSTGLPPTGFRGQLVMQPPGDPDRVALTFDIVGTINNRGQFYFIGQGAAGNIFVHGHHGLRLGDPLPSLDGIYGLVFVDRTADFGTFHITLVPS